MKRNHLIETFFLLSCIALFSFTDFIQQWDERRFTANYQAWQLKEKLELKDSQAERIEKINLAYYENVREVFKTKFTDRNAYCQVLNDVRIQRDAEILKTLTREQQRVWKNLQEKESEKILTSFDGHKKPQL